MITAQTTINLRLFEMPLQLKANVGTSTLFEAYSNFGDGQFAPDLDKAIATVCKRLGVASFLETEVKIDAVYAQYNLETKRLYVEGIINLPNSKAALILNFQPSITEVNKQDFAVVLDLNFAFDLADLPIIPKNELAEKLRLTLAFSNYNGTIETIPFNLKNQENKAAEDLLKQRAIKVKTGIQLQPNIQLPKNDFSFNYELVDFSPVEAEAVDLKANSLNLPKLPEEKGTKWFELNQSFGGLNLRKIGLQWKQSKATILLNMDYLSNGLEFSMLGLKASSALSLKAFKPTFDLHGIGVYYKNDLIELGGSLLRNDKIPQAYIGKMLLRLAKINIGAIGGFSKTASGENSFFAFANVAVPLGGVPAFFITGIAAGFGYNSEINLPETDKITDFPLLNVIKTGEQNPSNALAALGDFVNPKSGEKWFAAGVNFTSFQLVNGNVIAAYAFAKKQVSILGIARLILPTEKKAYLNLQFGLKSIYRIQEGEIQSNTQIQNGSYLIHKSVNLTGGIAIYTWLKGEHAGDFALTIGGYHPKYKKPEHFPTVPKVGFNWQVSETTKMEGNVYFALTNQAVMTGFNFSATYEKGRLKAYFTASTDMILQWKPFYFDFQTKVRLGASYQSRFLKNYKLDIGANLHLFGPETGGFIQVNWSIISFNIKIGNPQKSNFVYILDWRSFQNSFLPINPKDIIKININKNEFTNKTIISTDVLIPSNSLNINDLNIDTSSDTFGIRPMNKQQLKSNQSLRIINKKTGKVVAINYRTITKKLNYPAAIWSAKPLNTKALENEKVNAIAGFDSLELIGKQQGTLAEAKAMYFETQIAKTTSKFQSETQEIASVIESDKTTISTISNAINSTATITKRTAIVGELNQILNATTTELLPNDGLVKTAKNAERIYQSEPKIGAINKGNLILAKAKIEKTIIPTMKVSLVQQQPQLLHFVKSKSSNLQAFQPDITADLTSRSIQATPIDEKIHIQLGSAFIFNLEENTATNKIQFTSEVTIQIIAFDAYNQLIQFKNLAATITEFTPTKTAKRVAIKGVNKGNKEAEIIKWNSSKKLPLVNSNALLGDGFYLKMQVPIPEDRRIAAAIGELEKQNLIQTQDGVQKGYIDTLVFEDYREIVLVLSQKNSRISDIELVKSAVELSIPFVYKKGFQRILQPKKVLLKPRKNLVDDDGNIRLKFRVSNQKIKKKSETDKNWNGFALRLNLAENWEVKAIFLFKKRVKKAVWCEIK